MLRCPFESSSKTGLGRKWICPNSVSLLSFDGLTRSESMQWRGTTILRTSCAKSVTFGSDGGLSKIGWPIAGWYWFTIGDNKVQWLANSFLQRTGFAAQNLESKRTPSFWTYWGLFFRLGFVILSKCAIPQKLFQSSHVIWWRQAFICYAITTRSPAMTKPSPHPPKGSRIKKKMLWLPHSFHNVFERKLL